MKQEISLHILQILKVNTGILKQLYEHEINKSDEVINSLKSKN